MKKRNKIILYILSTLCLAAVIVFGFCPLTLLQDSAANVLLTETLTRAGLSFLLVCLLILFGRAELFRFPRKSFARSIAWCIPCILVAVVNFPFSALATHTASVDRTELIPLFLIQCIFIGVSEELLFRAVVHDLLKEKLVMKNGYLLAVILSSAIFGLWHFTNLLYGAGFLPTLLQVGYSFLVGAMLAVTFDKTKNIWICVVIHALFDFSGFLVFYLGNGEVHDTVFWILTAVVGVLCAGHILLAALKKNREYPLPNRKNNV